MLPVKPFNGVFWMILALTIVAISPASRMHARRVF